MIKLDIDYCCHDCPYFEPEITDRNFDITIVRCKDMAQCAYLYRKMREIETAASQKPECDL